MIDNAKLSYKILSIQLERYVRRDLSSHKIMQTLHSNDTHYNSCQVLLLTVAFITTKYEADTGLIADRKETTSTPAGANEENPEELTKHQLQDESS